MYSVLNVRDPRFSNLDFISKVEGALFYRDNSIYHNLEALIIVTHPTRDREGLIIRMHKGHMGVEGSSGGANSVREVLKELKRMNARKDTIQILDELNLPDTNKITEIPNANPLNNRLFEDLLNEYFY